MGQARQPPCSLLDLPAAWLDQLLSLPEIKHHGLVALLQTCRALRDRVLSKHRVHATPELRPAHDGPPNRCGARPRAPGSAVTSATSRCPAQGCAARASSSSSRDAVVR